MLTDLHYAMLGLILACVIVWIVMPRTIPVLKRLHFGQEIREEGPKSHQVKAGTPTMGGVIIVAAILLSVLIIALFFHVIDLYLVTMTCVYGIIGFIDDYIKIKQKHNLGLTVRQKFALQIIFAVVFTAWAYTHGEIGSVMLVPFLGKVDFGFWYCIITFIAIIAITNAVNLSDGLDGLSSGVSSIVMIFFLSAAIFESYAGSAVYAGAFIGACLGFLRYNSHPADVFMGDTGSLALGGGLAAIAIRTHTEIFFLIAGFIFVLEALSVVMQVGYYKISHGKRIFRMAPIHHHFELGGWKETRVVSTFYTWAALCVALAYLLT